mgnify:CR=1 FL=1
MGLAVKKEVLLIVIALFALFLIGDYLNPTGQAASRGEYYCHDTDGQSTIIKGTVTYNIGVERSESDFCLEEGKAGSMVHEFWCDGYDMKEINVLCAHTQKCIDGRCVAISDQEVRNYNY